MRAFVRLFSRAERPRVEGAAARVSAKVRDGSEANLLLAGTIGGTAALGLFLMGVPYFYVLALIAAVGEMIPGRGTAAWQPFRQSRSPHRPRRRSRSAWARFSSCSSSLKTTCSSRRSWSGRSVSAPRRHRGAARRRNAARHRRCHPRGADCGYSPGDLPGADRRGLPGGHVARLPRGRRTCATSVTGVGVRINQASAAVAEFDEICITPSARHPTSGAQELI